MSDSDDDVPFQTDVWADVLRTLTLYGQGDRRAVDIYERYETGDAQPLIHFRLYLTLSLRVLTTRPAGWDDEFVNGLVRLIRKQLPRSSPISEKNLRDAIVLAHGRMQRLSDQEAAPISSYVLIAAAAVYANTRNPEWLTKNVIEAYPEWASRLPST